MIISDPVSSSDTPIDIATEEEKDEEEETSLRTLSSLSVFNSIEVEERIHIESNLKSDSTVTIETDAGSVEFVGTPSLEVEVSKYEYLGFNPVTEFHVVIGRFWEHSECYLVDQRSARIDTIWSEPIFSRNDSLIISKSLPYGLDGLPNGFQVWTLNHQRRWTKVQEHDQQDWLPLEIKWVSDREFLVKQMSVDDFWEHGDEADSIEVVQYSVDNGG